MFVCFDQPGDEEDHVPKSVQLIVYTVEKPTHGYLTVGDCCLISHNQLRLGRFRYFLWSGLEYEVNPV